MGQAELRFSWKDERGTDCRATFTPLVDGTFQVQVPAGAGWLMRKQSVEQAPVALGWQRMRELELAPGANLAVDLD